ncbi:MAG: universal stress protein [Candidatus Methylumidiphilus alinenensis]|uniref:Universal stress protein n=1 Tax=Candidatus Methylumidiphilus alinenensis TaxID=2202197 RepID=A0A2W4RIK1_9GAMM|nr:MAG: universal stress protein [Candidatus Methylumidiphilus alinenensis]
MANYRKILLATDFSEFSNETARRAIALANAFGAEMCALHVQEPMALLDTGYADILPFDLELTEQMLNAAKARLEKLAEKLNIPKERQWVEIGSPKAEIVRVAAEQGIDLIVIGTHGRHGLGVLLGSTAASVVNHAGCDVLTVRLSRDH